MVSSRATTTGQGACMAAYRLTEPSAMAPNPPPPRAPTTSMAAPAALAISAVAGAPVSSSVSAGSRGATSPACLAAADSAATEILPHEMGHGGR